MEEAPSLDAFIRAAASGKEKVVPRSDQWEAARLMADRRVVVKMGTGLGKTLAIAMAAAVRAKKGLRKKLA